jgi:hypothetical protein
MEGRQPCPLCWVHCLAHPSRLTWHLTQHNGNEAWRFHSTRWIMVIYEQGSHVSDLLNNHCCCGNSESYKPEMWALQLPSLLSCTLKHDTPFQLAVDWGLKQGLRCEELHPAKFVLMSGVWFHACRMACSASTANRGCTHKSQPRELYSPKVSQGNYTSGDHFMVLWKFYHRDQWDHSS